MKASPTPVSPLRGQKLWLFRLLAILLPLVLLLVLEGTLRLFGYGEYPPLFTPIEGYEDYLQPHERVAARYFTTIENVPGIPFDSFLRVKQDSTLRIIVQGGSTTAGFPFYYGGSFPDMLEQRLLMTFPGRQVEVINTAMAAVNSYTLVDFAEEIIAQQPDAILIYAGHNEYYGALGVGSTQILGRNPAFVRLYLELKPYRTVQLLQAAISRLSAVFLSSDSGEPSGPTLMQNMVGEQRIPLDSDLYNAGLRQFQENLDILLDTYQDAGIPVFIGTVVSNERDQAPFLSGTADASDAPAVRQGVRDALTAFRAGDSTGALTQATRWVEEQPEYAAGWYARGKIHDAAGRVPEAQVDFRQARLRDELRFRAPDAINDIIRAAADSHGAVLVETESAIRQASPDGIPGRSLFLEHLHPNIDGNFVLADAFYESLTRSTLGQYIGYEWTRPIPAAMLRANLLVTPIDSLVGIYRVQQLMASWPFQPAGTPPAPLDTLEAGSLAGDLALQVYQRDMLRLQALDAYQQAMARSGNARAALQSIYAIIQRYPFLPGPYLSAANIQMALRRYPEAEEYVMASLERQESAEGLRMLGSLLINRGMSGQAIAHLERAVSLNPSDIIARYNLAGALALESRTDEARKAAEAALALAPDNTELRQFLASLPR